MQFYLQTFRHIFELRRLVIVVMATAVSFYMTARTIKLVGSWKRIGRQLKSARHGRQKAKKLQIAKVITRLLTTRRSHLRAIFAASPLKTPSKLIAGISSVKSAR